MGTPALLYCWVTREEEKKAYLLAALNDEVLSLLHSLCPPTKVVTKSEGSLSQIHFYIANQGRTF